MAELPLEHLSSPSVPSKPVTAFLPNMHLNEGRLEGLRGLDVQEWVISGFQRPRSDCKTAAG